MNINPMMLLPLLMNNKNGGENQDNEKIIKLINAIGNKNPENMLEMIATDEKTKSLLTVLKAIQNNGGNTTTSNSNNNSSQKQTPDYASEIMNDEITRALNVLLNYRK